MYSTRSRKSSLPLNETQVHLPLTSFRQAYAFTKWMTQHSGKLPLFHAEYSNLMHLPRDDPGLDETTRLRNRIAELESLVRELRGEGLLSFI